MNLEFLARVGLRSLIIHGRIQRIFNISRGDYGSPTCETHLMYYSKRLALLGVNKQFGTNKVVDNVTFGVEKGECFALLWI